jgi:hypothetical protein
MVAPMYAVSPPGWIGDRAGVPPSGPEVRKDAFLTRIRMEGVLPYTAGLTRPSLHGRPHTSGEGAGEGAGGASIGNGARSTTGAGMVTLGGAAATGPASSSVPKLSRAAVSMPSVP